MIEDSLSVEGIIEADREDTEQQIMNDLDKLLQGKKNIDKELVDEVKSTIQQSLKKKKIKQ